MNIEYGDIPARSEAGLAALDIFYNGFNDINFYVEDEDQENLYEALLKKLFPSVTVQKIFPLGGKKAVVQHAMSTNNENITAFRAYIVDKDFDDLRELQLVHPNIFYLDRFCIENYLTEEHAIVEIVVENNPKKKRADVLAQLALKSTIESTYASLRSLFLLFLCVQELGLNLKNCGASPETYCLKSRRWEIDDKHFYSYQERVVAAARIVGVTPPLKDPLSDERFATAASAPSHTLVSGKYVAAMLFHYVKSKYGLGSMTFDSFIFRLAKNCSVGALQDLATRIAKAASDYDAPIGVPHQPE